MDSCCFSNFLYLVFLFHHTTSSFHQDHDEGKIDLDDLMRIKLKSPLKSASNRRQCHRYNDLPKPFDDIYNFDEYNNVSVRTDFKPLVMTNMTSSNSDDDVDDDFIKKSSNNNLKDKSRVRLLEDLILHPSWITSHNREMKENTSFGKVKIKSDIDRITRIQKMFKDKFRKASNYNSNNYENKNLLDSLSAGQVPDRANDYNVLSNKNDVNYETDNVHYSMKKENPFENENKLVIQALNDFYRRLFNTLTEAVPRLMFEDPFVPNNNVKDLVDGRISNKQSNKQLFGTKTLKGLAKQDKGNIIKLDKEIRIPDRLKEIRILDKDYRIPDKDSRLPDKDSRLPDNDSKITEKENKTFDRYKEYKITNNEIRIPDRDFRIPDKFKEIRIHDKLKDIRLPDKENSKMPDKEITIPDKNVKLPDKETRLPDKEKLLIPEKEIRIPEKESRIPDKELRLPEKEIRIPDKEIRIYDKESKQSDKESRVFDKEVKMPVKEIKIPVKEIRIPDNNNKDVKIPNKDISKMSDQEARKDESFYEKELQQYLDKKLDDINKHPNDYIGIALPKVLDQLPNFFLLRYPSVNNDISLSNDFLRGDVNKAKDDKIISLKSQLPSYSYELLNKTLPKNAKALKKLFFQSYDVKTTTNPIDIVKELYKLSNASVLKSSDMGKRIEWNNSDIPLLANNEEPIKYYNPTTQRSESNFNSELFWMNDPVKKPLMEYLLKSISNSYNNNNNNKQTINNNIECKENAKEVAPMPVKHDKYSVMGFPNPY